MAKEKTTTRTLGNTMKDRAKKNKNRNVGARTAKDGSIIATTNA